MSLKDPLLLVSVFCHLASIIICALILSETLALYKSFTYLLTYFVLWCCTCSRRTEHFVELGEPEVRSVEHRGAWLWSTGSAAEFQGPNSSWVGGCSL